MKRILIGNKYFRIRRGILVPIPEEWVGKTVHDQTLRERKQSRLAKRLRLKRHRKLLKI